MKEIESLIRKILLSIVDDAESVVIDSSKTEKGTLFEVKVAKGDVGKVIGKQGRVASSMRTIVKTAGAKLGERVMLNVFNKPLD